MPVTGATPYRTFGVPVAGGSLFAGQWGTDGPTIVAAHGITANHLAWVAVGEEVGRSVRLIAPDLRGRGRSASLPGPYGMAAHARDLVAVLDAAGAERGIVVGHSMGAFVAAVAAARHPDRVAGVVLVDGGLPLPRPAGTNVDEILEAMIGPAMARLSMTFASPEAYRAYWRAHPAFREWDERVEAYLDHDLVGDEPELRSSVSVDAVRADAADTLEGDLIDRSLTELTVPAVLVRAERGPLDDAPLYPDTPESPWPRVRMTPTLTGTNHYTILFRRQGVDAILDEVRAACTVLAA